MPTIDFAHICQILGSVAIGAPAVWFYTEIAKNANTIPWLTEGMKLRLRAFSGLLSAAAALSLGLSTGTLDVHTVQGLVTSALSFATIWGGAHVVHKTTQ